MTRTRIAMLIALTMGAFALPVAPAAATPTCDGKTATIVGRPGAIVDGTNRADVIVSNGAENVYALGGSDRICMTGTPPDDYIGVDAGSGHDRVFIRTQRHVFADLGPGDDVYVGNAGKDFVDSGVAATGDRITTGAGEDQVRVGHSATPTADVVRLGFHNDYLELFGLPAGRAVIEGGYGVDHLSQRSMASYPDGRFDLDNFDEVARVNGSVVLRWDSFQNFDVLARDEGVYFSGSKRDETIFSYDLVGSAMGSGDDRMHLGVNPVRGLLRGGAGRDLIRTGGWFVTGDVAAGRIDTAGSQGFGADDGPEFAFVDVEDLTLTGETVRVLGDSGPNRLDGFGCDVDIRGYGGADTLSTTWQEDFTDECVETVTMLGGEGDDRMIGGPSADRLYGGAGNDSADGRRGTDLCRAEQRTDCELQ